MMLYEYSTGSSVLTSGFWMQDEWFLDAGRVVFGCRTSGFWMQGEWFLDAGRVVFGCRASGFGLG